MRFRLFRPTLTALIVLAGTSAALAADINPAPPKFLGETSCSSSSCHGGAGEKRSQCITWSRLDFHTRAYATLTTARATRIAGTLGIPDATESARCTSCHAPFQTVPHGQLADGIDITQGVSCESCHGPAENWIRSHTRPDFSHLDRAHAGMRDLNDLYVRANTCVACHQNVDADLLRAGHPELIFELDGQAVTEPKHWREAADWSGPQTWLVGQAAALREMSWQLTREPSPTDSMGQRWAALLWLLQTGPSSGGETFSSDALVPTAENIARAQPWADQLARTTASATWTNESTVKWIDALAGTAAAFRAPSPPQPIQARRAERLVLALDRLLPGLGEPTTAKRLDPLLDKLFKDAQSLPGFDPQQFAADLEQFQAMLNK